MKTLMSTLACALVTGTLLGCGAAPTSSPSIAKHDHDVAHEVDAVPKALGEYMLRRVGHQILHSLHSDGRVHRLSTAGGGGRLCHGRDSTAARICNIRRLSVLLLCGGAATNHAWSGGANGTRMH